MVRTLVITRNAESGESLRKILSRYLPASDYSSYNNGFRQDTANQHPEILLLEIGEGLPGPETWEIIRKAKKERNLPVIALVPRDFLTRIEPDPDIDDILVSPYDPAELVLRINRLLRARGSDTAELIKGESLIIDTDTCEVTVDGHKVELTFKEYELLKLLASNKGRVFTREVLLDKIWGYDYYGGDRTVDVHVRRLRGKIESNRTYIETVRNIGYRFVKEDPSEPAAA
jgi:two-component system, OmpR family, alkaline phosphatase synthesis response regulator PhoP